MITVNQFLFANDYFRDIREEQRFAKINRRENVGLNRDIIHDLSNFIFYPNNY